MHSAFICICKHRQLELVLQPNEDLFLFLRKHSHNASPPHAIFDVVVNDKIQFIIGEAIMRRKGLVYLINDGLCSINSK